MTSRTSHSSTDIETVCHRIALQVTIPLDGLRHDEGQPLGVHRLRRIQGSLSCQAKPVNPGDVFSAPLVALPGQSPGVPWPTESWSTGRADRPSRPAGPTGRADRVAIEDLLDAAFDPDSPLAQTYAVVIISGGRLAVERYGGYEPKSNGTIPVGPESTLLSWSMTRSITEFGQGHSQVRRHAIVVIAPGAFRGAPGTTLGPWRVQTPAHQVSELPSSSMEASHRSVRWVSSSSGPRVRSRTS